MFDKRSLIRYGIYLLVAAMAWSIAKPGYEAYKIHKEIVKLQAVSEGKSAREGRADIKDLLGARFPAVSTLDSLSYNARRVPGGLAYDVSYEQQSRLREGVFLLSGFSLSSDEPFLRTYQKEE